jgi:NAD(P)-dependent dehydrogenase (short-subunit alcohol dehydrogenase family)
MRIVAAIKGDIEHRTFQIRDQPARRALHAQSVRLALRFRSLVDKHYLTLQTVKEYARLLDVSPNHLSGAAAAEVDLSTVRATFESNLFGAWQCVQAFLPLLKASANARIVNVSSEAGAMGGRPIAEGAASVVWVATLPENGPSGGFFRDGQPLAW